MSSKKIILAIVEGPSDMESLDEVLNTLTESPAIKFAIVNGDILQQSGINSKNILIKIKNVIETYIEMYKLQKSDILRVIHLVDIDGVYIDKGCVHLSQSDTIQYTNEGIYTKWTQSIIERNERKAALLNQISSKEKIWTNIPYSVYYFSCNLEWVLHNSFENHTNEEKRDLAAAFAEKYKGNINQFISFINTSDLIVNGSYKDTWEYIQNQKNCIERKSNFHLFVNEIVSCE